MSIFNGLVLEDPTGNGQIDLQKIRDSLTMLNEQLKYMFGNLTPEDNYSKDALKRYIQNENKIMDLELNVEGLGLYLEDLDEYTKTEFEVVHGEISMKVSKGDVSSELSLEPGLVTLKGNRVAIESDNFSVSQNGTLRATNGKFSGDITASTFTSKDGAFWTDESGTYIGGFYAYTSDLSGVMYLATHMSDVGMGQYGPYCFWCGDSSNDPPFYVEYQGIIHCKEIYLKGSWWEGWSLTETLEQVYDYAKENRRRIEDLEDAG